MVGELVVVPPPALPQAVAWKEGSSALVAAYVGAHAVLLDSAHTAAHSWALGWALDTIVPCRDVNAGHDAPVLPDHTKRRVHHTLAPVYRPGTF